MTEARTIWAARAVVSAILLVVAVPAIRAQETVVPVSWNPVAAEAYGVLESAAALSTEPPAKPANPALYGPQDAGARDTRELPLYLQFDGPYNTLSPPADCTIAVGKDKILAASNTILHVHDKQSSGTPEFTFGDSAFWSGVITLNDNRASVRRPQVVYDAGHDRYVFTQMTQHTDYNDDYRANALLVAVSRTGNPAGSWYKYRFPTPEGAYIDYHQTAVTKSAIVVGYQSKNGQNRRTDGASLVIIPLQPMLDGLQAKNVVANFGSAELLTNNTIPLVMPCRDTRSGIQDDLYLVNIFNQTTNLVGVWRLTGLPVTPSLMYTTTNVSAALGGGSYTPQSAGVHQMGTSHLLSTAGDRCHAAAADANSVWMAHEVSDLTCGCGTPSIAWYQIRKSNYQLIQGGLLSRPSTTSHFMPAITVAEDGGMLIGFTRTDTTDASIGADFMYACRGIATPLNQIKTLDRIFRENSGVYTQTSAWGQYFGAAMDPVDGSMWTFGTYTAGLSVFRTRIARIVPDNFTVSPLDPTSITEPTGLSSFTYTINNPSTAQALYTVEKTGAWLSVGDGLTTTSGSYTVSVAPRSAKTLTFVLNPLWTTLTKGVYTNTISFRDMAGVTISRTLTLNVNEQVPVALPASIRLNEDSPMPFSLGGQDVDPGPLVYTITRLPASGVVLDGTLGTTITAAPYTLPDNGNALIYSPNQDFFGGDSLDFTASDGVLVSQPATASFIVANVNDPPVAVLDTETDQYMMTNYYNSTAVTLNAYDPDGEELKYVIDSIGEGLLLEDPLTSRILGTPHTLSGNSVIVLDNPEVPGSGGQFTWHADDGGSVMPPAIFSLGPTGSPVDTVGHPTRKIATGAARIIGNVYNCRINAQLGRIEQYLGIEGPSEQNPAELEFFVYRADALNGPYTKIYNSVFRYPGNPGDNPTSGTLWYRSDEMNLSLQADKFYIIGSGVSGPVTYYCTENSKHPVVTSWGWSERGFTRRMFPSPLTTTDEFSDIVYVQRLYTNSVTTRRSKGAQSKTDAYEYDFADPEDNYLGNNAAEGASPPIVPTPEDEDTTPSGPHFLNQDDYQDWFALNLEGGVTYDIKSEGHSELYKEAWRTSTPPYNDETWPDTRGDDLVFEIYSEGKAEKLVRLFDDWDEGVGNWPRDNHNLSFTPPLTGTYFLRVMPDDPGTSMTYYLTATRREGDPGNYWDASDPGDDVFTGGPQLVATKTHQVHGPHTLFENRGDAVEHFKISLRRGETYIFSSEGGTGDVHATLYRDNGTELVSNDDSAGNGQFLIMHKAEFTEKYRLAVKPKTPDTIAKYDLHYYTILSPYDNWDQADDTAEGASELLKPVPAWRTHGNHHLSYYDLDDWFRVYLDGGNVYNILSNGNANTQCVIYDSAMNPVATDTDSGTSGNFEIYYQPVMSGYYYVHVSLQTLGEDLTPIYYVAYRLASNLLDEWDHGDNEKISATELPPPTYTEQAHGPHKIQTATDTADWFKVYLAGGIQYNFNSMGGTGDPVVEIYAETGSTPLAADDNSGGGGQFNLTFTPTLTGYHYLKVYPRSTPDCEYMFRYRRITHLDAWDPFDDGYGGATAMPQPVATVQTHGPHILSSEDKTDWYKFYLQAFTQYVITTNNGSGDNTAVLYRDPATEDIVASDDNSGGNQQFGIVYTPPTTGWYYLRVTAANPALPDSSYYLAFLSGAGPGIAVKWGATTNVSNRVAPKAADETPQVVGDGKGNWIVTWASRDTLGATVGSDFDIQYARSSDNGRTWTLPACVNTNAATDTVDDRQPAIETDGNGTWICAWNSNNALPSGSSSDTDIHYAVSLDNGASWSFPRALNTNAVSDSGNDAAPVIKTDGNGKWIAAWMSNDSLGGTVGTDRDILYSTSTDAGAVWSAPKSLNTDAGTDSRQDWNPSIAPAPGGKWMVAWMSAYTSNPGGEPGLDWDIHCARSTDGGVVWTAPSYVNPLAIYDLGQDQYPSVAYSPAGTWFVAWHHNNNHDDVGDTPRSRYDVALTASADDGITWAEPTLLYDDSMDVIEDLYPKVASDASGNVMLVWQSRNTSIVGGKSDAVFSFYSASKHTWQGPTGLNTNSVPGTKEEYNPAICTDRTGTWVSTWASNDQANGLAGPDQDILASVATFASDVIHDDFDTGDIQPPGSPTGWSVIGMNIPGYAEGYHRPDLGAYLSRVASDPDHWRLTGFVANKSEWLPYSAIGSNKYVRGKFYIFSNGVNDPTDGNQVPSMRMRLANRYAVTTYLEVWHHAADGTGDTVGELRPSTDPLNPSLYRLDYDPIDVPYLATSTTGEGIMRGFEIFAIEPQENGAIGLTESVLCTYGASIVSDGVAPCKVYAPGATDAGDLRVFNSSTDLQIFNFIPAAVFGEYSTIDPDPASVKPTYTESNLGVTLDSGGVAANRIGVIWRDFFPGSDLTQRVRVEENKQYKVRVHITSTRLTNENARIVVRTRAIRYGWMNRLEVGGPYGTNGYSNVQIATQSLPGIGCMNPDKIGSENGGWYNLLVCSPMNVEIRPEFSLVSPLSVRMPNICAQPGPGVNASSMRDLRVAVELWDTTDGGTMKDVEKGNFTIDRIEVRAYDLIPD